MRRPVRGGALGWLGPLSALALAVGCSGRGGNTFGGPSTGADPDAGAADASAGPDGSGASNDAGGAGSSSGGSLFGDGSSPASQCSGLGTGTCKDGTYKGNFSCMFEPDGGAAAADSSAFPPVAGTLTLKLTKSSTDEFVDVASGTFTASSDGINANATIGGTLDCNSGVFTGQLTNGTYSGWFVINGTFQGPLRACYDGSNASFVDGSWVMTIAGAGTCPGGWSATYSGP
jgi:hypothetical protein